MQLRALAPIPRVLAVFPAHGVTVCAEFGCDTEGRLCCNPNGCPALGSESFDVNQDHDASGGNLPDFGPHQGRPADPACHRTATNAVSTLPAFVSTPCREDKARPAGCNREGLGEASATAHAPRCDAGGRGGRLCDPGVAIADECPGGALCSSRSTVPAASLVASPCNGPMTVVQPLLPDSFEDGDIVLQSSVQLAIHRHALDSVNYVGQCVGEPMPGAACDEDADCGGMGGVCTCHNKSSDGTLDGFGCDGIACTDDDTTPKQDPVKVSFTTGTTGTTIFDRNMGTGLDLTTGAVTGAVPINACANLINGDPTGYVLNGTFPILDDPVLGDIAVTMQLAW